MTLIKRTGWAEVLDAKARLVHQQIASLQRWVEKAGGGARMLDELSAPYYGLLRSIYEEDLPLARTVSKTSRKVLKGHRVSSRKVTAPKLAARASKASPKKI